MALGSLRVWTLAARPKTLTAGLAPVLVGTGLAAHDGAFAALPALAALLGATLIQIGTNLANDYYDFVRGGDTAERVGPLRVTQAGLIPPHTVRNAMLLVLALAFVPGAYLVAVAGWPIILIGLVSLACAVLYTGGPFPLAYHGLGDVFVFVFFGLVAVGGTYYVQALAWPSDALLAGAGLGALSTALLVVNNLRDIRTDALAGKRTLAVRLGRGGTQAEYALLLALAALVPVVGVAALEWPVAALASLVGVAASWAPLRAVFAHTDPRELLPALGATARAVALYGALLALGLAWG
ncbi:MAG: 1,4-dihydroxy-2-naphthoate polyprenyltransferase [Gemmatimonadetes bacterium]|nr:1,4-dihydroxy-2-naphthoate polyprenyltransferase [Gemmatimonadota bacterium]